MAWYDQDALIEGFLRDRARARSSMEDGAAGPGGRIDLSSAAGLSGMDVTVEHI